MNKQNLRPGIRAALTVLFERLRLRESFTSLILPTRYGKSDVMRLGALEAHRLKLVAGTLAFTPSVLTTEQLVDKKKVSQMALRYDLDVCECLARMRQLKSFSEHNPFSNGEVLLSANMQLALHTNLEDCLELIQFEKNRTGLPIAIFLDECQFVSDVKKWGLFFDAMSQAGALIIPLTATAYRGDKDALLGFIKEVVKRDEDSIRWSITTDTDGKKWANKWQGAEETVRIRGHHETSFQEAWEEMPIVLCKLSRETIDIPCTESGNGKKSTKLSELSKSTTWERIGKIVRDSRFIEEGLRRMIRYLGNFQRVNPRIAAIITTGSDRPEDEGDNKHARTIDKLIQDLAPEIIGRSLKTKIVTLKAIQDEQGKGADQLRNFADGDDDILIVKQMGTVGFDCPRAQILFDCSPVRTISSLIQRWMRPATPFDGFNVAYLIMPADVIGEEIWNYLIRDKGGEAKLAEKLIWKPETLLDRKEVNGGEETPAWMIEGAQLGSYDDSKGINGDLDWYEYATRVQDRFPEFQSHRSTAELAEGLKSTAPGGSSTALVAAPRTTPMSLDHEIDRLRQVVHNAAVEKATVWMHTKTSGYNQEIFKDMIRLVWRTVYGQNDLPRGIELRLIKGRDLLIALAESINQLPPSPVDP